MYNALRMGPLAHTILQTEDSGIGSLLLLFLYGIPLIAIIAAVILKSRKSFAIIITILALLYGTDFLVLAFAVLIACKVVAFFTKDGKHDSN